MSAYVVSMTHIDFLVTFAIRECDDVAQVSRYVGRASEIGQVLLNENYRSVNFKYSEQSEVPPYRYRVYSGLHGFTAANVIKACQHFDHQACETSDYEVTEAARIVDAIRQRAFDLIPGYDAAPWGINE